MLQFQKAFVERVMERLTSLVSSPDKYLSPVDAVLLYRQLYVLKNFLEYGTVVANQIRVGYAEEFRYCIVSITCAIQSNLDYPYLDYPDFFFLVPVLS